MELGNEEKNKGYNKNLSQYKVLRAAGSLEEREREQSVESSLTLPTLIINKW